MASKYLSSDESNLEFADDLKDSEVSEMGEEDATMGGFKAKDVSVEDDEWLDDTDKDLENFEEG